jgi:glycosyltransferase involved in cell wall biosynthesis
LHDCWALTGHCANFDYVECNKWQSTCSNCPQVNSYPSSLIDNSLNNIKLKSSLYKEKLNLFIVTPSKWLKNIVNKSILKNFPSTVINNGINTTIFNHTKSLFPRENKNTFIILCVANYWNNKKGLNTIIRLSKVLDFNFRIIVVGQVDKKIIKSNTRLTFIKRTNSIKELAELYNSADIFLNPTLEDNFPTVNLEALNCGLPVITYNTGGSPEVINETNGIVVTKNDFQSLINCIITVYKNYYFDRVKISIEAKKYDKQFKYNEYLALYRKILGI